MKTAIVILLIGFLLLGCTGTAPAGNQSQAAPPAPQPPAQNQTPPPVAAPAPSPEGPSGPIDCKDAGCIRQAIQNGCQDAFLESRIDTETYSIGSANTRVDVTNMETSCRVEAVQTNAAGDVLNDIEVEFRLPLEKCGSGEPQSYATIDGRCRWVDLG
jgi:PBP1b-binding outer membrane lipoprotein LpoB